MRPTIRPTLLSLVALAAFPFAASATASDPGDCCGAREPDVARADFAVWQAQAVEGQINAGASLGEGLRAAAALYEQSASLRPLYDPEGVASLRSAAAMFASQDRAKAISLLLDAADWATQIDRPASAAHSYLDAATLLAESKWLTGADLNRLHEWVASAERLARKGGVTPEERAQILARTANW